MNFDLRRGAPLWAILVGAVIGGGAGYWVRSAVDFPYPMLFFAVLGALSAIDIARRLLPNIWVLIGAVILTASLVHATAAYGSVGVVIAVCAVMGLFISSGLMAFLAYVFDGIGLGDVKLMMICGGWIGAYALENLLAFVAVLGIGSALAALGTHLAKKETVPYGPVIVVATYAASVIVT